MGLISSRTKESRTKPGLLSWWRERRSVLCDDRTAELIVHAHTRDVVVLLDRQRRSAGGAVIVADGAALVSKTDVEVFCLHAPLRSDLPFRACTHRVARLGSGSRVYASLSGGWKGRGARRGDRLECHLFLAECEAAGGKEEELRSSQEADPTSEGLQTLKLTRARHGDWCGTRIE